MSNEPRSREVLLADCSLAMNRLRDHPKNTKYMTDVVKATTAVLRADQQRISALEETLVILRGRNLVSSADVSSAYQEAVIRVGSR